MSYIFTLKSMVRKNSITSDTYIIIEGAIQIFINFIFLSYFFSIDLIVFEAHNVYVHSNTLAYVEIEYSPAVFPI